MCVGRGRGRVRLLKGGNERERLKEGGREGKQGDLAAEVFPELIKCSEGRKLPASIPVPLDKFTLRSLQILRSAEVAS